MTELARPLEAGWLPDTSRRVHQRLLPSWLPLMGFLPIIRFTLWAVGARCAGI